MLRIGGYLLSENEEELRDPERYVFLAKEMGYTAIYAPKHLSVDRMDEVREAKRVFEKAGLPVAEVGYWENLMDTRPEVRKRNRREMVKRLQLAEELEAGCAVNVTGGYCEGIAWSDHHPRNFSEEHFEEAASMAREFIDEVKPKHTHFAYEIFAFSSLDTPQQYARMLRAVDRKAFAVHLDLTNMLRSPREIYRAGEITEECLRLFPERIVSAHIKDVRLVRPSVTPKIEETVPGRGEADLLPYIRGLAALPQQVTLMLEHLKSMEEYREGIAFIRNHME